MTDEENWKLRGVFSQVMAVQQSIVEAFASNKLTDNRKRELKRQLQHLLEQVEHISE